jgi:transcriptional regulator with XRE-family HTH domain
MSATTEGRAARRTNLGDALRLLRTVRETSLRDMAPDIGISYATLMRIEHGQDIDADTMLKLLTWLMRKAP